MVHPLGQVNLLDDGLVDVVLDSAASGINTVEREGVSIVHPARFIMIGSGNPAVRLCVCVRVVGGRAWVLGVGRGLGGQWWGRGTGGFDGVCRDDRDGCVQRAWD